MWSAFLLVCWHPVNPNQDWGTGSWCAWFAKQCTLKGQTGCAATLKGTPLARAVFQRAECLACGKLKHERREKFVFSFWSNVCTNNKLQHPPICCLHNYFMHKILSAVCGVMRDTQRNILHIFAQFSQITIEYMSYLLSLMGIKTLAITFVMGLNFFVMSLRTG